VASRERQLLLGTVGFALIAAGAYVVFVVPLFTVTNASVTSDTPEVFICPQPVKYTAVIETRGETGVVEYRFVHDGLPMQVYDLSFSNQRARSLSLQIQVAKPFSLPGLPPIRQDTMAIEVLAPNHYLSNVATVPINC